MLETGRTLFMSDESRRVIFSSGVTVSCFCCRPGLSDVLTQHPGDVRPKYVDVLSLSHSRSGGAGHRPNPFQVAPESSRVGCEGVSWPGIPPGVIVGRTLEHQMLDRLVGAVAVWADGRAPALDPVKTYSCTREVGRASSEQDLTGDVTMSQPACTAHNDAIAPDTHGLMLYALALLSSRRGLAHAAVVSTSSRLCYIIFITCDVLTAMPPCESKDDKNVLLSAVSTFGLLNCCATFCAISCTAA